MKLIFLDLDGVLVTRRLGVFEENLLQNLKRVVEETGATIVLSSDWRRHPAARLEAKRALGTAGLTFIGCTPIMSAYIAQRPTEILQWKKDYQRSADAQRITHWLAIDDRALLEERHGSHLRGHFVQTQPVRGFTAADADLCISMLNQELPPAPSPTAAHAPDSPTSMPSLKASTFGTLQSGSMRAVLGGGISSPESALKSSPEGKGLAATGPMLLAGGGAPSARKSMPGRGIADVLGPGVASFGSDSPSRPAGLPLAVRQRGRSVGATTSAAQRNPRGRF